MSSIDLFITELNRKSEDFILESTENRELSSYLLGKGEAYQEIAHHLTKSFHIDCRYIVVRKDRELDRCTLKKYCDPRNCTLKESF